MTAPKTSDGLLLKPGMLIYQRPFIFFGQRDDYGGVDVGVSGVCVRYPNPRIIQVDDYTVVSIGFHQNNERFALIPHHQRSKIYLADCFSSWDAAIDDGVRLFADSVLREVDGLRREVTHLLDIYQQVDILKKNIASAVSLEK